jgi:hypothetical protein
MEGTYVTGPKENMGHWVSDGISGKHFIPVSEVIGRGIKHILHDPTGRELLEAYPWFLSFTPCAFLFALFGTLWL